MPEKDEGAKAEEGEVVERYQDVDQTLRDGDELTGLSEEDRERQGSAGYDKPEDDKADDETSK